MELEESIRAPSFAFLDSHGEVGARYKHLAPVPGQFVLQRPYQEPAEPPTDTKPSDKRQRKRRKTAHVPNEAELESGRRHDAFIPVLQAAFHAYAASQAATAAAVQPAAKIAAAEVAAQDEGAPGPALPAKEAAAQGLDFRALSSMLRTLRPKFGSPTSAQPVDLFGRLIRNDADKEQVCNMNRSSYVTLLISSTA